MKLNVGSGVPRGIYEGQEWVNVDPARIRDTIPAYITALPFRDSSFEEIHCIHVFEHLPRNQQKDALSEMARVLSPGGSLWLEVPDFIEQCRQLVYAFDNPQASRKQQKESIRVKTVGIYGRQYHDGDFHHYGFYPDLLKSMLMEVHDWKRIDHLKGHEAMISNHYVYEPVILINAIK